MVIYYKGRTLSNIPMNTQGFDIETVGIFVYLGVHMNNRLDW